MKKFVSKMKKSFILEDGEYEAQITGASETVAEGYPTPQIEVDLVAQTEDGLRKIKAWYNLQGYQKNEDGSFIENAKGERKLDPSNTEAAMDIFCGMAHDAGIEADTEFELEDLIGLSLGIVVQKNERGNTRVARTLAAGEVAHIE